MGRPVTPLNIETQPNVGQAFLIRNVKTKTLTKCATTSQSDLTRKGSKVKALRAFSGEEPFFTVKVGSLNTEIQVLKFLCGAHHKKCLDTTGAWEWTEITWAQARKDGLKFDQPNLIERAEAPVKAKKVKVAKVRKTRKAKLTIEAPTEIIPEVVEEEVVTSKVEQSQSEFEAEIEADHQATLAKLQRAAN